MTAGFAALPSESGSPGDDDAGRRWAGTAGTSGPRWLRMPALTAGLLGVSVFWSVEMSYAPPYLLSLGVSKAHMALVFAAGPLSGLIVQPLVGILSDVCKSSLGRRRPYIALGTGLCVVAMLILGFTRGIATVFTTKGSSANDSLTIALAVLAIYCIDFSVNAVMAVDRTLIVDTLPAAEQVTGNAWATQMAVVGGVVGLYIGVVDLPSIFSFLGSTQLEALSILAALLFAGVHLLALGVVRERVLISDSNTHRKGFFQELHVLWETARDLPRVIKQIFAIQFFASIGWFPIFNYLTVYVNELYKQSRGPALSPGDMAALDAAGTRAGTRAMFISSLVSLVTTTIAPFFVVSGESRAKDFSEKEEPTLGRWIGEKLENMPKVHLASIWAASHFLFSVCMLATVFIDSVGAATKIIAVTGFAGAIGQWAPFALIGEAVLASSKPENAGFILLEQRGASREDLDDETIDEDAMEAPTRRDTLQVMGNASSSGSTLDLVAAPVPKTDLSVKAGVILGIHNLFIVIPQFIVTAVAAAIFALVDTDPPAVGAHKPGAVVGAPPPGNVSTSAGSVDSFNGTAAQIGREAVRLLMRGEEEMQGTNSVGLIFRVGGISALVAGALAWRLARELKRELR